MRLFAFTSQWGTSLEQPLVRVALIGRGDSPERRASNHTTAKANNPQGTGPGGDNMQPEAHTLGKSAGNRGKGRVKGVPNKITADLKRAILEAAEAAGGPGGTAGYLTQQAHENPTAFMALLGKVLPTTLAGDANNPLSVVTRIELVAGGK